MQEPIQDDVREFGVQANGLAERSAELQSALAVAARASFGRLKSVRAVYHRGLKNGLAVFETVELGEVSVVAWLREQTNPPEYIQKLWPETGQWETCWCEGRWV